MNSENVDFTLYSKFIDILNGENDRGAVLSSGVFLEESLEKMLKAFLADCSSTKDLLNGFSTPIGSLGAKAKLSYSLSLLDKDLFLTIEIIRKIRNEFAHDWQGITFDSDKIKFLLNNCLTHPILKSIHYKKETVKPRTQFQNIVSICLFELHYLPEMIKKEERIPKRSMRIGKAHSTLEDAIKAAGTKDDFEF